MTNSILHNYIHEFKNLQIDRAHGNAPHQPVLLLAAIELIEQGQISENKVLPSPELMEIFMKYWTRVTERKPNIALPFYHLSKRSFWHLRPNPGYEKALEVVTQIKTVTRLREIVAYASFDNDLFVLLTEPKAREIIRQTIINTYLADFKQEIQSLIAEEQQIGEYSQKILLQVEHEFSALQQEESSQADNPIRKRAFRLTIMRIYEYTCAVCQLHILTLDGQSVTEAAHIIPLKKSNSNDVRNGISLCRLHHWAFDEGMISFSDTYKVIVSELMLERGPTEWKLTTLSGKEILLPEREELYPAQKALSWHRAEVFRQ